MSKKNPSKSMHSCSHPKLILNPSPHASEAGYTQPSVATRLAATTPSGSVKAKFEPKSKREAQSVRTFPAPLILPDDDLALDATYPAQSLRSWIREKDRNKVDKKGGKRTVYVAAPPGFEKGVEFVGGWGRPSGGGGKGKKKEVGKGKGARENEEMKIARPNMEDLRGYLEVFYHGLPVKLLSEDIFNFTTEVDDLDTMPTPDPSLPDRRIIGLSTQSPSGNKGIRARPTPKGLYSHQLNLDDLLDAAIQALPDDAYALLLLVEHDLYEDEDDEFVCGRAYGGSRVAVISMARYDPSLDAVQGVGRTHAWPASHCEGFVDSCVGESSVARKEMSLRTKEKCVIVIDSSDSEEEHLSTSAPRTLPSPMEAALSAHLSLPLQPHLTGLWLSRICRTAAHELGHCFGMDHCVYYACSMQGSASIVEDARQPPYLCPVDVAKLLYATGDGDRSVERERERYEAIKRWCEERSEQGFFAAYAAWIGVRLEGMR